jgi:hypothetical protein
MTAKSLEQVLGWGVGLVEYWASPVTLGDEARAWFAEFFAPSAKRCAEHPRFFDSVTPDIEKKLRCMGEYLSRSLPSGSEATEADMIAARQAMVATMGGTILCDPPPSQ